MVSPPPAIEVLDGEATSVVLRIKFVVSADGGGGNDGSVETFHRKHSPFPKYDEDGRGYSERYAPNVCPVAC